MRYELQSVVRRQARESLREERHSRLRKERKRVERLEGEPLELASAFD